MCNTEKVVPGSSYRPDCDFEFPVTQLRLMELQLSNSNIEHPRGGETNHSLHYGSGKEMHFATRGKGTDLPHGAEAMVLFHFGSKNVLTVWVFDDSVPKN